jgi:hypothetical protein
MQKIAMNWKLPMAFVAGALAAWLAATKGATAVTQTPAAATPGAHPTGGDDVPATNDIVDFSQLG